MKALRVLGVACACALLIAAAPPHTTIYGFTPITSDKEWELESRFLDIPTADGALVTATAVAQMPHYAGTPGDYRLALYMRDKLKEYGFDASLESLTARVDVPKRLVLGIVPPLVPPKPELIHHPRAAATPRPGARVTPEPILNRLVEHPPFRHVADGPPFRRDQRHHQGLAPDGPTDGLDLRELPDVADADTANPAVGLPFIAGSADGDITAPLTYAARGTEADYALLAAHNINVKGAVVLIRYGADDRRTLVRRAQAKGAAGVVLYNDPLEDGAARGLVYPNGPWRPLNSVQRGSVGEGITIPVLPISAANARVLLESLHGPTAQRPWAGGMGVSYPFARGPVNVHLVVELVRKTTTLWNTIGVLHGSIPGQTVVLGAHRDAWVYGLGDNGGGVATLLEAARGLGYLAQSGWQPGRTVIVAGWDGEELGSYGTLAYFAKHGDDIRTTSVAYLDTEQSVTGPQFGADVAAPLASTVAESTHMVPDPAQPGATVYDRWAMRSPVLPRTETPPGAGDNPSFLFGSGTPSAGAGFSGPFGPYHSSYDTLQYARSISDPEFGLHRAAAQLYGIIALRLIDADVIPYHFTAYTGPMRGALLTIGSFARRAKMHVDTRGFDGSIRRFNANAVRFDAATANAATAGRSENALEAARILDIVTYGVDGTTHITFPDVIRAIRDGNQGAVDLAVARARTTLDRAGDLISR